MERVAGGLASPFATAAPFLLSPFWRLSSLKLWMTGGISLWNSDEAGGACAA